MMQPDLLDCPPPPIAQRLSGDRDGNTFDHKRDVKRLNRQTFDVYNYVAYPKVWRSLKEISEATGHPEASVSARLRDLRKPKFGGFEIERRHVSKGLWQYRFVQ